MCSTDFCSARDANIKYCTSSAVEAYSTAGTYLVYCTVSCGRDSLSREPDVRLFVSDPPLSGLWDPKITTPPGLYVFGVACARLVAFVASVFFTPGSWLGGQECEAAVLRIVNWGFSIGTLCVMRAILARRMVGRKRSGAW